MAYSFVEAEMTIFPLVCSTYAERYRLLFSKTSLEKEKLKVIKLAVKLKL